MPTIAKLVEQSHSSQEGDSESSGKHNGNNNVGRHSLNSFKGDSDREEENAVFVSHPRTVPRAQIAGSTIRE